MNSKKIRYAANCLKIAGAITFLPFALCAQSEPGTDAEQLKQLIAQSQKNSDHSVTLPDKTFHLDNKGVSLIVAQPTTIKCNRTVIEASNTMPRGEAVVTLGGSQVTLEGCTLKAGNSAPGVVLLRIAESSNIALNGTSFQGSSVAKVHGIELAGNIRGLAVNRCSFINLGYALFKANNTKTLQQHIIVQNSSFQKNSADDLEFNSPAQGSEIDDVQILNNDFGSNVRQDGPAGFAIGFANASNLKVIGNKFHGYPGECIHIEDRSYEGTIWGNDLKSCGLVGHAAIRIIGSSNSITLENNHIDLRGAKNVHGIEVSSGGSKSIPDNIVIRKNTFDSDSDSDFSIGAEAQKVTVSGNKFNGPVSAAQKTPPAIVLWSCHDYSVKQNEVHGFHVAIQHSQGCDARLEQNKIDSHTIPSSDRPQ